MKEQSGRSLIEIVGVLAIGVIMIASAYNMYRSIDQRQKRMIAYEDVKEVARKTKILYEYSGYDGLSVSKLVSAGALSSSNAPIGSWTISSHNENKEFKITLSNLTRNECKYFATKKSSDWAYKTSASCGASESNPSITFFVK
jgi:Tfp pilus assembly protein PilE